MKKDVLEAAHDAQSLVRKLGRASTPPVVDRGLGFKTHIPADISLDRYPVLVIGEVEKRLEDTVDVIDSHPNSILAATDQPSRYQALLVNCAALGGVWGGALSGWSGWKTDLIYEACRRFRAAQISVYLIQPPTKTTAYIRWASLATAIFPGYEEEAEETGNRNTALWDYLSGLGGDQ